MLSALLTAQNIPVPEWNSSTIDNVLLQGDKMYLRGSTTLANWKMFEIDKFPKIEELEYLNLP